MSKYGSGSRPITSIEQQVLQAVAERGTIGDAADALGLSQHTVDWHLDRLRNKTTLRYLPQLIAWACWSGYVHEPKKI